MKRNQITEAQMRAYIYEQVLNRLNEIDGMDDKNVKSFVILPKYKKYVKTACLLLAWKGLDFDIAIKSIEYKKSYMAVYAYVNEYYKAVGKLDAREQLSALRKKFASRPDCAGMIEAEKQSVEMTKTFMDEAGEFIYSHLGSKFSRSKQMEKEAGMALIGQTSYLPEFNIQHGAVFCARDFFRWVEKGKPSLEDDGSDEVNGIVWGQDEADEQPSSEQETQSQEPENESNAGMLEQILNNERIDLNKLEQQFGIKKVAVQQYRRLKEIDGGTGEYQAKMDRLFRFMLKQIDEGMKGE